MMKAGELKKTMLRVAVLVPCLAVLLPLLSGRVSAAEQTSGGAEIPQPLPGQLSSKFRIDRSDPEGSIPEPKERDSNPLEYGYLIQDLLTRPSRRGRSMTTRR
jgi:hypothetical protein